MKAIRIVSVFAFVVSLLVSPSSGQTGVCQPVTKHACVGRDLLRECVDDGTGQLVASSEVVSCQDFAENNFVCYGAVNDFSEVCGAPPPQCNDVGNFPIEGRCRNFYTCFSTGVSFVQFINECGFGFEFNKVTKQCSSIDTAGCSVPAPSTTPAPPPTTTTLEPSTTTAINNEATTTLNPTTTLATITTTQPPCPALRRLEDPTSCRHFYQCFFFGRRTRLRCPVNLFFDTKSGFCRRTNSCGTRPV